MVKQYICLVLLVVFISIAGSRKCDLKTESGEVIKVCCADYEPNGTNCIGCSIGYTSHIGQMCNRCSSNMYGERCRYECSCSRFEICDNVEGCVEFSPTTRASRYSTFAVTQHFPGKRCLLKTERREVRLACCGDSEARGIYCIACSKGYTSTIGQNCLPCTRKTYGERCKFECHCSDFEICNHVEGCVDSSSTTGISLNAISYNRTYISTIRTSTDSLNDITTLHRDLVAKTNGDNTELVSRKIIAYYILPLLGVVLGYFCA